MWPAGLISRIADEQGVGITNEVNIEREIEHAPRRRTIGGACLGLVPSSRRAETITAKVRTGRKPPSSTESGAQGVCEASFRGGWLRTCDSDGCQSPE